MIGTHMMTERRRRDEVVVRLERPGRTGPRLDDCWRQRL